MPIKAASSARYDTSRLAALALGAFLTCTSVASARGTTATDWAPAGLQPTTDTLETVLATMRRADPGAGLPAAPRVDTLSTVAGGKIIPAVAHVRGFDYRVDETLDAAHIAMGRANGLFWRQNSAGTTRTLGDDVAGDDADRWPLAAFGFDATHCTVAGISNIPRPAWVLADAEPASYMRWLYVDRASGDIVREISREGTRVVTYDFGDVRSESGVPRAHAWHISGAGGDAQVTVLSSAAGAPDDAALERPAQGAPEFSLPDGPRKLSVVFDSQHQMVLDVRVNGRHAHFTLDTGTVELLLGPNIAARFGGTSTLGHGLVPSLVIDGAVAGNVPAISVADYGDGILGSYGFFRGRIIHVDYAGESVEMLPRDGFVPPAGALPLPTNWSEGMPMIDVRVGNALAHRVVLDSGSERMLMSAAFVEAADVRQLGTGAPQVIPYNEGPVTYLDGTLPEIEFGRVRMTGVPAMLEIRNPENLDLPIDGIIGTGQMRRFEWWFDADGPLSWFRPY